MGAILPCTVLMFIICTNTVITAESDQTNLSPQLFQDDRYKKLLLNFPLRYMPKRAPSGFMGMRGKRLFDDDREQLNKRAPSGFLGMRGKKGSDDILRQLENLENIKQGLNDYDSSFYENLQNERQLLNEFNQLYNLEPEYWNIKSEDKRAPSHGFFGMRGKKDYSELDSDDIGNDIDKRAPSSGFFGMRGKKSTTDDNHDENTSLNIDKRAPMGFQGMRGKKDMYESMSSEKRAPAPGFFGMRGKKGPIGSSFFGIRGKKGPFEFRGKFVGVRGKKVPAGPLQNVDLGDLSMLDLHNSVGYADSNDFETSKRGPSGFMGMRGKKSTDLTAEK